jgi:hypothetical protein
MSTDVAGLVAGGRLDDPARRRRLLWISAIAFFVFLAAIAVLNARMKSTGGPGILSLEFAGTRQRALEIMRDWGHKGIVAARWENVFDYGFLAAYGLFLTVAVEGARRRAGKAGRAGLARAGRVVLALPGIAAASDGVQNAALLLLLGRHAERIAPPLSLACGVITSALALISLVYLTLVKFVRPRVAA